LLTISFSVVWTVGKPFASYQFKYATTAIAWLALGEADMGHLLDRMEV
jgi:hypothetical protein